MSTLPMLRVRGPQAGMRRRTEHGRRLPISASSLTQFLPRTPSGPAPEPANFSDRSRFGLWRPTTAQAAREKESSRQDRCCKEKVMIEPNEGMSEKEVSSKNIENKISSNNTKNRISSKSISNKEIETNLQSKPWSSSFLKASTGEMSKNVVIAEQEKNNEHCPEDISDKLSESTDDDGEDTSDEDKEEDSNPNKDTHAPLELMTEFLRAEMGHDYHLAKKLCQMILIYEPENPEAKEFFSLIEEMLLMEKAQNLEEDDDESEEDNSESEGESTEDPSEESSDECEDG
ncbi:glutamate-rich protein 2 isoform X1 [Bubalus kerabau]|uniref:glutamate-rich protein 2 isoform X1 n=3 Tax=Bubalus carabanensis TaxID=3119969 RepID=UPI00244ED7BB|nr:glutamate-rich protein 2 isoform X1 [Bubalus carabanensis]